MGFLTPFVAHQHLKHRSSVGSDCPCPCPCPGIRRDRVHERSGVPPFVVLLIESQLCPAQRRTRTTNWTTKISCQFNFGRGRGIYPNPCTLYFAFHIRAHPPFCLGHDHLQDGAIDRPVKPHRGRGILSNWKEGGRFIFEAGEGSQISIQICARGIRFLLRF